LIQNVIQFELAFPNPLINVQIFAHSTRKRDAIYNADNSKLQKIFN